MFLNEGEETVNVQSTTRTFGRPEGGSMFSVYVRFVKDCPVVTNIQLRFNEGTGSKFET